MSADAFVPASFPRLRPSVTEAERARERARGYGDGHAEGYRAGMAAAAAAKALDDAEHARREAERTRSVDDALRALRTATAALQCRTEEVAAASQSELFARAVELTELILAAELAGDEAPATAALRRAVTATEPEEAREVRLHPDDLRVLEGTGLIADGLVLTADPSLDRGDAMVTLDEGLVDARIRSALDRARRALDGAA